MDKFSVDFRNEVLYGIMENDTIFIFSYLESTDNVLKKINKKEYDDKMNHKEDCNLDILSIEKIGRSCINYNGQIGKEDSNIIFKRIGE